MHLAVNADGVLALEALDEFAPMDAVLVLVPVRRIALDAAARHDQWLATSCRERVESARRDHELTLAAMRA